MNTRKLVRGALIAAIYVALCLMLAPLSYGAVQVRISEALTLLPVLCPDAIWGITIGCLISNMLSFSPWDMLLGTLASLTAAVCTYKLASVRIKNLPFVAALPPVLINAVVIGAEITYIFMPETASFAVLMFNMLSVGAGQIISCFVIGLPLVRLIEKTPALKKWFAD